MSSRSYAEALQLDATEEQLAQLVEYESYLDDTDYTVIKVYEAMITDPDTVDDLKREYAEIFTRRAECRDALNELMESLRTATQSL